MLITAEIDGKKVTFDRSFEVACMIKNGKWPVTLPVDPVDKPGKWVIEGVEHRGEIYYLLEDVHWEFFRYKKINRRKSSKKYARSKRVTPSVWLSYKRSRLKKEHDLDIAPYPATVSVGRNGKKTYLLSAAFIFLCIVEFKQEEKHSNLRDFRDWYKHTHNSWRKSSGKSEEWEIRHVSWEAAKKKPKSSKDGIKRVPVTEVMDMPVHTSYEIDDTHRVLRVPYGAIYEVHAPNGSISTTYVPL